MLVLLALLILGMVWVASALIDQDAASRESLYGALDRLGCSSRGASSHTLTLKHLNSPLYREPLLIYSIKESLLTFKGNECSCVSCVRACKQLLRVSSCG